MSEVTVDVGNIRCGGDQFFLISGPCVIEGYDVMSAVAESLAELRESCGLPIIFKSSFQKDNRSSAEYYRGPGLDEGLKTLQQIKAQYDFPILSDIHYRDQVDAAAEVLDVIQIPAYLCMQTDLLLMAAKSAAVINIKHGQFLAPENMIKPVQKAEFVGNKKIILTERGYTFGYNDLVVDPRALYELKQIGYPVVFDVTHSIRKYGIPSADPKGGARQYLPILGQACVACGIDGLFLEVHPNPEKALCDAASQLPLAELKNFIQPLLRLNEFVKSQQR